jgi:molybdate-binding protein/DNA-binding PadR family transcriptional regulator
MVASLALLGLLLEEPLHGYAMRRAIETDFAPFWRIEWARLYRSLARLEGQGYVRATEQASRDGPQRKIYHLTRAGRLAFLRWLNEASGDPDETWVKARLAISAGLDIDRMLSARESELRTARDRWRGELEQARASADAGRVLIAEAAMHQAEAALAPLDLARSLAAHHSRPEAAGPARLTIAASDDPLLAHLASLAGTTLDLRGSLGGLTAVARREADAAGAHLLDLQSGEYNTPFLRHLAPEEEMLVIALAMRETGVMVAPGNPRDIRDLRDLARPGVRLVNRPQGTGTRLLFFARLRQAGVDPHALLGWERTVATHDAVAACVAAGIADAGPGIRAAAEDHGLAFLPLGIERYDLIMPRRVHDSPSGRSLLEILSTKAWTSVAARAPGYDTSRAGQVLAVIS